MQEQDWAANASVNSNAPCYVIQTLDGADIGTIGLQIDGARAVLGIAIHDSRYWGRGLGTDAVRTLVDGAFLVRPLVRIELTVLPDNARAIRSYERAGFTREGVLRRYLYRNGRHDDVVLMSVLAEEWAERKRPAGRTKRSGGGRKKPGGAGRMKRGGRR